MPTNAEIEMTTDQARDLTQEVKKILANRGVWFTIAEINEPRLKFIKIEASIKVKQ